MYIPLDEVGDDEEVVSIVNRSWHSVPPNPDEQMHESNPLPFALVGMHSPPLKHGLEAHERLQMSPVPALQVHTAFPSIFCIHVKIRGHFHSDYSSKGHPCVCILLFIQLQSPFKCNDKIVGKVLFEMCASSCQ